MSIQSDIAKLKTLGYRPGNFEPLQSHTQSTLYFESLNHQDHICKTSALRSGCFLMFLMNCETECLLNKTWHSSPISTPPSIKADRRAIPSLKLTCLYQDVKPLYDAEYILDSLEPNLSEIKVTNMQYQHLGYRIQGFYKIASFANKMKAMMATNAKQKLEALEFLEKHGLIAALDFAEVSRATLY